jgi:hypothetical protein
MFLDDFQEPSIIYCASKRLADPTDGKERQGDLPVFLQLFSLIDNFIQFCLDLLEPANSDVAFDLPLFWCKILEFLGSYACALLKIFEGFGLEGSDLLQLDAQDLLGELALIILGPYGIIIGIFPQKTFQLRIVYVLIFPLGVYRISEGLSETHPGQQSGIFLQR